MLFKYWRYILVGVGSVVVGGMTGHILTRRHYEAFIEDEAEAVKAHYEGRLKQLEDMVAYHEAVAKELTAAVAEESAEVISQLQDALIEKAYVPAEETPDKIIKVPGLIEYNPETKGKINYSAISAKEVMTVETVVKSTAPVVEIVTDDDFEPIQIVTEAEIYNAPLENYETNTLNYYINDDILVDDMEEIIPDPDSVVGSDALLMFKDGVTSVYVRNDDVNSYFEILVDHRDFGESVLGFKEDRKTLRKMRESYE